MGTDQPPLPRPPDDPENLRRLREEARQRMEDERMYAGPASVYGGPPVTRRWTLGGILMLIAGAGAAIAGAIWGFEKMTTPVYGGPPPPPPDPKPVYGGPVPPPANPPQP